MIMNGFVSSLLLDFDSFLRSGSCTKPEIAAFVHGNVANSNSARTIV